LESAPGKYFYAPQFHALAAIERLCRECSRKLWRNFVKKILTKRGVVCDREAMDPVHNIPANAGAALPQQLALENANQLAANHSVQVAQDQARIANGERLADRLLKNVKLADLANIVAGMAGIYIARKSYIPRLAGILLATSGQPSIFKHLACMLPLLTKFEFVMGLATSFLAGVVGSNNYREFILGYFLSKAASMLLDCVCHFASNCMNAVRERGLAWCIQEVFSGMFELLFKCASSMFSAISSIFQWQSLSAAA
jgi:hypothetical protein